MSDEDRRLAWGPVRRVECEYWETGLDCRFNEWNFHVASCVVWAVSAVALFALAVCGCSRCRAAPTGIARWCLLLTSLSALFASADAFLVVKVNSKNAWNPEGRWKYDPGPVSCLGSLFLMIGLWMFAGLWCRIVMALTRKYTACGKKKTPATERLERHLQIIQRGYKWVAVIHTFTSTWMFVASIWVRSAFDISMLVYMAWCFTSICVVFTGLAVLMLHVTQVPLKDFSDGSTQDLNMDGFMPSTPKAPVPELGSLRLVTRINLVEQVMYNVVLLVTGLLYLTDYYNQKGEVQAVVKAMFQFLMWVGHLQVLFFFIVCDPKTDPLYSHHVYTTMMHEIGEPAWDIPTVIVDHPLMRDDDAGRLVSAAQPSMDDRHTSWESCCKKDGTGLAASPAPAQGGPGASARELMIPTVVGAGVYSPAQSPQ
mmetsp:Transcript_44904/g.81962  ORF Transcript_44904/g.81962 Transcript_44904/m.81962 type:complete len:426 (-) Transcript_44904:53-1330(-)